MRGSESLVAEGGLPRNPGRRLAMSPISGAARLFGVASLSMLSSMAMAQTEVAAADEPPPGDAALEEIVITGSRVVKDGSQAPTPVSVLGAEQLQSYASSNIADAVNTLPALAGSATPTTSVTTASSGASNINALNLRALGENRTLVLIDGQRSVASSISGLVDINLIPQDLVERVEVVTGGASAVYGSDALGGVVNFVLNKEFEGLKISGQGGITTYGDGDNWKAGLTYGTSFGEGRGHFIFSGGYRYQAVIPTNTRDWNLEGWQFMNNPAYDGVNGEPRRLLLDQVSVSNGLSGGIITDTALRGTAFGPGGTPYQFEFGDLVSDPDMHGGDWELSQVRGSRAGAGLSGGSRTQTYFSRLSWDLTDNVNVYAQAAFARDQNRNFAFSLEDTGTITLSVNNPFIPESVRNALIAAGETEFHLGTMHPDLPIVVATNDRKVTRLVTGAEGNFGDGWKWDAYYQLGISKIENLAANMYANDNLDLAYDAVIDPATGSIVCASTLTDPGNGCVPYNPMGIGVNSAAAIKYVTGDGTQMWRSQELQQHVAAASVSGSPFSTWAGEVSMATGIEWREESIGKGKNDEISQNFGWWVGGYPSSKGSYNVKEVFLETLIPLAKDLPFMQSLDFNGAIRATDYSTSGNVQSYKLGLNWSPVDSARFRANFSHDIRAPNLEELFSRGSGGAPAITNPWLDGATEYISSPRVGNEDLSPEKADSYGVGVVLTPSFAPGLMLSVDYWDINIEDSIGLPATQTIIDNCYDGQTQFCSAITFGDDGESIDVVLRQPFNYTSQIARGVDYEASYSFAPSSLFEPIPGMVTLRALATNYIKNATNTEGVINDTAGENTSDGPPSWKWTASVAYTLDSLRTLISARGTSSGVYDNDWIECTSNCPESTSKYVTVSDNHIASAIFWDASVSYMWYLGDAQLETYVNVKNVFNTDPPIVAPNPGGYAYTFSSSNANLYDLLGRTFAAGFRLNF